MLSVGLDVGTTSTQMVVSRLRVRNKASGFAVPDMEITDREILYQSPVHFTPLLDESHVDGKALETLILEEYRRAGPGEQPGGPGLRGGKLQPGDGEDPPAYGHRRRHRKSGPHPERKH